MSAVDTLFQSLRSQGKKALMPFVTAGDPDLPFTGEVLREVIRRGAHLCELGIPYSDPIADGPIIQASYTRALDKKIKLSEILDFAGKLTPDLGAPLVSMVSYAIIHRRGLEGFTAAARAAGLAGLIVPDLPVEESAKLSRQCRAQDLSLIQLVTPTTSRERALRITAESSGFLYYVSVAGITGERTSLPQSLVDNVGWLRSQTELPICVGFGISLPQHVRMLAPVADGLIVGSAIVRRVALAGRDPRNEVLRSVGDYVTELLAAFE